MLRAFLTAVALGVIIGQATLDYVFPEVKVTEGYDPATWRPCPGRKVEKVGKQRLYWYCGPDATQPALESSHSVGAGATSRRSEKRTDPSGAHAARGGR